MSAEAPATFLGNYVPGCGPKPCSLMFVGEAPGAEEDAELTPFIGLSGAILDQTILRFGVPRQSVYITNLYKRRPSLKNDDPSPEQIAEGLAELLVEIEEVDPDTIACLGTLPSQALWAYCSSEEFPGLDAAHGLAHEALVGSRVRTLVFCYHPGSGMRVPFMAERFAWDMRAVCRGPLQKFEPSSAPRGYGFGPQPSIPYFQLRSDPGIDTEGDPQNPTHMSWSVAENTGRVMLAEDVRAGRVQIQPGTRVFIHNAPWDLPVLRALGIDIWELACEIVDPMILAFVLQDEPQGLKDLAYRRRGVLRKDFNGTVLPYFLRAVQHFFCDVRAHLAPFAADSVKTAWDEWRRDNPSRKDSTKIAATEVRRLSTKEPNTALYEYCVKALDSDDNVDWRARLGSLQTKAAEYRVELPPVPAYDLRVVPQREMIDYTCADSDDVRVIGHQLLVRVKQEGLEEVARQDHQYLPLFDKFLTNGLPIDLDACHMLKAQLQAERFGHELVLRETLKDTELNVNSPDQMAAHISRLQGVSGLVLRRQRMTESGHRISTDEKACMQLRAALKGGSNGWQGWPNQRDARGTLGAVLDEMQLARGTSKLEGYVDKIIKMTAADGRLRDKLKNTRVYSGRLAGFVLTLPRDHRIRSLIRAGKGRKIVAVDLSQIEPRTMAHESQDPELCRIYREGRDLYAESASKIMSRPLHEVKKGTSIRQAFKTIDLAMLYLIGGYSLYQELLLAAEDESIEFGNTVMDWGLPGTEDIRQRWLGVFAGIEPYNQAVWAEARKRGYVSDMIGRRRYCPHLYLYPESHRSEWVNKQLKSMAEAAQRETANLRIQGGAGSIKKRGCIAAWNDVILPITKGGIYCEPLLDVHDELVLEVDESWADWVAAQVKSCMERDSEWFRVPIVAEAGVGDTWADAK